MKKEKTKTPYVFKYPLKKINPRTGKHIFYLVEFREPVTSRSTTKRGFFSITEAKNWLIKHRAEHMSSTFTGNQRITFSEVAKKWLENKRRSGIEGSTYLKYESDYRNHLKGAFNNKPIKDVNLEDCQTLVYDYADKYVRWDKKIGVFSSVFKFAVKYDIVARNPFDRVDRPKVKHVDHKGYTPEQTATFIRAIDERYKSKHPKIYTLLWLILHTGVRKEEATGLRWCDVNFKEKYIHVQYTVSRDFNHKLYLKDHPKNRSSIRDVPITDKTIEILKAWRVEQQKELEYYNVDTSKATQLVFTNQQGGFLSPSKPRKWIMTLEKAYNLPHKRVHDIRHTTATLLADGGHTATEIAGLLGHKDTTITTQVYIDRQQKVNHSLAVDMEKYDV